MKIMIYGYGAHQAKNLIVVNGAYYRPIEGGIVHTDYRHGSKDTILNQIKYEHLLV